jgi:hypothetical protein
MLCLTLYHLTGKKMKKKILYMGGGGGRRRAKSQPLATKFCMSASARASQGKEFRVACSYHHLVWPTLDTLC